MCVFLLILVSEKTGELGVEMERRDLLPFIYIFLYCLTEAHILFKNYLNDWVDSLVMEHALSILVNPQHPPAKKKKIRSL
jgi:hypothetical protein